MVVLATALDVEPIETTEWQQKVWNKAEEQNDQCTQKIVESSQTRVRWDGDGCNCNQWYQRSAHIVAQDDRIGESHWQLCGNTVDWILIKSVAHVEQRNAADRQVEETQRPSRTVHYDQGQGEQHDRKIDDDRADDTSGQISTTRRKKTSG